MQKIYSPNIYCNQGGEIQKCARCAVQGSKQFSPALNRTHQGRQEGAEKKIWTWCKRYARRPKMEYHPFARVYVRGSRKGGIDSGDWTKESEILHWDGKGCCHPLAVNWERYWIHPVKSLQTKTDNSSFRRLQGILMREVRVALEFEGAEIISKATLGKKYRTDVREMNRWVVTRTVK
ncbi:predicted protein [Histoplasma capsulatum var. duboisii H88]|uniref:Predicted protein n=2 Tax=Ajellomyces capsulatus TaxID=5037 RepID=F0UBK7_AJEC8|nr:predicted protein [Histoplasma capsulatum H143]EGC43063.1 predicted protein [Histoplasma capsulatum var. duboisii H88]